MHSTNIPSILPLLHILIKLWFWFSTLKIVFILCVYVWFLKLTEGWQLEAYYLYAMMGLKLGIIKKVFHSTDFPLDYRVFGGSGWSPSVIVAFCFSLLNVQLWFLCVLEVKVGWEVFFADLFSDMYYLGSNHRKAVTRQSANIFKLSPSIDWHKSPFHTVSLDL